MAEQVAAGSGAAAICFRPGAAALDVREDGRLLLSLASAALLVHPSPDGRTTDHGDGLGAAAAAVAAAEAAAAAASKQAAAAAKQRPRAALSVFACTRRGERTARE